MAGGLLTFQNVASEPHRSKQSDQESVSETPPSLPQDLKRKHIHKLIETVKDNNEQKKKKLAMWVAKWAKQEENKAKKKWQSAAQQTIEARKQKVAQNKQYTKSVAC